MKLLPNKTANTEPPTETVAPPAPAPEPAPVVADDQAPEQTPPEAAVDAPAPQVVAEPVPAQITPTAVIAALVTAASVVFTTWSVYDLINPHSPAMVAIAAGLGLELVWLFVLATEWQQAGRTGRVDHRLTATGWGLAALTAAVIAVHGVVTSLPLVALAVLPLAAKAGWHWLTRTRAEQTRARLGAEAAAARAAAEAQRQAEEEARRQEADKEARESKLSADLTEEQQAELAALERETAYVSAKTEKELQLDAARAHADQQRVLAEIRRRAEQQMTVDEASADIEVRRSELRNRIHLAAPLYTARELPAGGHHEQVPDDPSGFGVPPVGGPVAGFGGAMAHPGAPRGGTGADLRVPRGMTPDASPTAPGGRPGAAPPANTTAVPLGDGPARLLAWVTDRQGAGEQVSVRGAARDLQVTPRTIRRWRDALDYTGAHDMSALYPEDE